MDYRVQLHVWALNPVWAHFSLQKIRSQTKKDLKPKLISSGKIVYPIIYYQLDRSNHALFHYIYVFETGILLIDDFLLAGLVSADLGMCLHLSHAGRPIPQYGSNNPLE